MLSMNDKVSCYINLFCVQSEQNTAPVECIEKPNLVIGTVSIVLELEQSCLHGLVTLGTRQLDQTQHVGCSAVINTADFHIPTPT